MNFAEKYCFINFVITFINLKSFFNIIFIYSTNYHITILDFFYYNLIINQSETDTTTGFELEKKLFFFSLLFFYSWLFNLFVSRRKADSSVCKFKIHLFPTTLKKSKTAVSYFCLSVCVGLMMIFTYTLKGNQ